MESRTNNSVRVSIISTPFPQQMDDEDVDEHTDNEETPEFSQEYGPSYVEQTRQVSVASPQTVTTTTTTNTTATNASNASPNLSHLQELLGGISIPSSPPNDNSGGSSNSGNNFTMQSTPTSTSSSNMTNNDANESGGNNSHNNVAPPAESEHALQRFIQEKEAYVKEQEAKFKERMLKEKSEIDKAKQKLKDIKLRELEEKELKLKEAKRKYEQEAKRKVKEFEEEERRIAREKEELQQNLSGKKRKKPSPNGNRMARSIDQGVALISNGNNNNNANSPSRKLLNYPAGITKLDDIKYKGKRVFFGEFRLRLWCSKSGKNVEAPKAMHKINSKAKAFEYYRDKIQGREEKFISEVKAYKLKGKKRITANGSAFAVPTNHAPSSRKPSDTAATVGTVAVPTTTAFPIGNNNNNNTSSGSSSAKKKRLITCNTSQLHCGICNKVDTDGKPARHVKATRECIQKHLKTAGHIQNAKMVSENQAFRVHGCRNCGFDYNDKETLLCDGVLRDINGNINNCNNYFHTFCLKPPLKDGAIPDGDWVCPLCIKHAAIDYRNNFELAKRLVEKIQKPCAAIAGDMNNLRNIISRNTVANRNCGEA